MQDTQHVYTPRGFPVTVVDPDGEEQMCHMSAVPRPGEELELWQPTVGWTILVVDSVRWKAQYHQTAIIVRLRRQS